MAVLYIKVRKNHFTVREIESKREVSGSGDFSNQRLLIADFFKAEKVLCDLIEQIYPSLWWRNLLRIDRFDVVISALEMIDGGLSQVEERVLQEVVAGATRMRYRQLKTHAQVTPLNDAAVSAMIAQR